MRGRLTAHRGCEGVPLRGRLHIGAVREYLHTVVQVTITVPHDFGDIVDMFEVQNGRILNIISASVSTVWLGKGLAGRELETQAVTLSNVGMDSALSARLFVLANSESVRIDMQNNLKRQN